MLFRKLALLALVLIASLGLVRAPEAFLPGVKRVVFLGDSITHGGHYIECIEAYAVTKFPDRKIEFIVKNAQR